MLEIKTITEHTAQAFDTAVNTALAEGWELVRRECFITGADRATTLYAELERITDEPEEDEEEEVVEDGKAKWLVSRDPRNPYRCSVCGYTAKYPWRACPDCSCVMGDPEVI